MGIGGTRRRGFRSFASRWLLMAFVGTAVAVVTTDAAAQQRRKKPPAAAKDPAPSTNKTQAADLFKRSSEAYLHGDFATAIKLLEEANALDPQPVLVYNMAKAHEGLGHVDEAVTLYERYLSQEPGSPDRGAIEQRLATLHRQQEDRKRLEREKADVEERRLLQDQQAQQLEQRAEEVRNTPPAAPPRRRSVGPYVVGGIGVAGLVTGTVFGFLALDKEDAGQRAVSAKDASDAADTGKTFATVSNVSFIVGGVLAAAGAVWWVLDGNAIKRQQGKVGFRPGGLLLRGEF